MIRLGQKKYIELINQNDIIDKDWERKYIDKLNKKDALNIHEEERTIKGNEHNIKNYQDLRETLMKYPVLKVGTEIVFTFRQCFLEFKEPISSYEVRKNAENEKIEILPSGKYDAQYILPQNIFTAITGLKDHFIKKDYATQIEPSKFWMPERFIQVYHGKLGEEIVNFVFEQYSNFKLKEIFHLE